MPKSKIERLLKIAIGTLIIFGTITLPRYQNSLLAAPLGVPIRLKSLVNNRCGTGILQSPTEIVTVAHLTAGICGVKDCPSLEITGPTLPNMVTTDALIIREIPSLDLSLIKLAQPLHFPAPTAPFFAATFSGLAGYPGCASYTESPGDIVQLPASSVMRSAAKGSKGNSGSPIVQAGKIVGIAQESDNVIDAVFDLLFGIPNRLKGRPIELTELLTAPPADSLTKEADTLVEDYVSEVLPKRSFSRLIASMIFANRVDQFAQRLSLSALPESALASQSGLLFGRSTAQLFVTASEHPSALTNSSVTLIVIAALESTGFFDESLTPLDPRAVFQVIDSSGLPPATITRLNSLVRTIHDNRFPGLTWALLWYGLLVAVIFGLYAYSLGTVWGQVRGEGGGIFLAIWNTAVVALLFWPVSWITFLLQRRRKRKRAVLRKAAA